MKIMMNKETVGKIKNIKPDFPWLYGDFIPKEKDNPCKEAFDAIELNNVHDDSIIEDELFENNSWFLKDGEELIQIDMPCFYKNGRIGLLFKYLEDACEFYNNNMQASGF